MELEVVDVASHSTLKVLNFGMLPLLSAISVKWSSTRTSLITSTSLGIHFLEVKNAHDTTSEICWRRLMASETVSHEFKTPYTYMVLSSVHATRV